MPNTQINDQTYWKNREIQYMLAAGWIVAGGVAGTYKLTPAGVAESQKWLNAESAEKKIWLKLLLNNQFSDTFNGTGAATTFTVRNFPLTSDPVTATVGGALKVETTDLTVNRVTGVVTFLVAPATGTGNVVITSKADLSGTAMDLTTLI